MCDCGNSVVAAGTLLRNGGVKSCGCLPKDHMREVSKMNMVDETGNRYGRLTVLQRCQSNVNGQSSVNWECICDCGTKCVVPGQYLRDGSRDSCANWICQEDMLRALNDPRTDDDIKKDIYFSGHFDGEGCISFQRDAKGIFPGLTARVSAVFKPVIEDYQSHFGGTVNIISRDRRYQSRVQWQWTVSAQSDVIRFINRVIPYSKEKKSQLELARTYLMQRIQSPKYGADRDVVGALPGLVEKMSELKRFEFKN